MTKIYVFEGRKGDIQIMNEIGAHQEMRNRNAWQRGDLMYLGACDDRPLKEAIPTFHDIAMKKVLNELPKVKRMEQQIELINLDLSQKKSQLENVTDEVKKRELQESINLLKDDIKRKEIEIEIYKGNTEENIREARLKFISSEIDQILIKIQESVKEQYNEVFKTLVLDPKDMPRNFNKVTSSFGGGDDANTSPADFLNGI